MGRFDGRRGGRFNSEFDPRVGALGRRKRIGRIAFDPDLSGSVILSNDNELATFNSQNLSAISDKKLKTGTGYVEFQLSTADSNDLYYFGFMSDGDPLPPTFPPANNGIYIWYNPSFMIPYYKKNGIETRAINNAINTSSKNIQLGFNVDTGNVSIYLDGLLCYSFTVPIDYKNSWIPFIWVQNYYSRQISVSVSSDKYFIPTYKPLGDVRPIISAFNMSSGYSWDGNYEFRGYLNSANYSNPIGSITGGDITPMFGYAYIMQFSYQGSNAAGYKTGTVLKLKGLHIDTKKWQTVSVNGTVLKREDAQITANTATDTLEFYWAGGGPNFGNGTIPTIVFRA